MRSKQTRQQWQPDKSQNQGKKGKANHLAPQTDRPLEVADVAPGGMMDNVMRSQEQQQQPATPPREFVQPKLTIGEPNDKYEQEADRVAKQVVQRMHAPNPPSLPNSGGEEPSLQCKHEVFQQIWRPLLQADGGEGGTTSEEFDRTLNSARSGGQALDSNMQRSMGEAMGTDFSGVKVHTDATANQLSESIQAKAFTTGRDVFFKRGAYQPNSESGQELIAHELTHVVQQNSNLVQSKLVDRPKAEKNQGLIQRSILNLNSGDKIIDRYVAHIKSVQIVMEDSNVEPGHKEIQQEELSNLGNNETLYIAGHGQTDTLAKYSPNGLASMLNKYLAATYEGTIVLVSCHTGEEYLKKGLFGGTTTTSYANELATALSKLRKNVTITIQAPVGQLKVEPLSKYESSDDNEAENETDEKQDAKQNDPMQMRAVDPQKNDDFERLKIKLDEIFKKVKELEKQRLILQSLVLTDNTQKTELTNELVTLNDQLKNISQRMKDKESELDLFLKTNNIISTNDGPMQNGKPITGNLKTRYSELYDELDDIENEQYELTEQISTITEKLQRYETNQNELTNIEKEFWNTVAEHKMTTRQMMQMCLSIQESFIIIKQKKGKKIQ